MNFTIELHLALATLPDIFKSQAEFQQEICGDNPLHYREIVQAHLDFLGREPESEELQKLGDQVSVAFSCSVCVCLCLRRACVRACARVCRRHEKNLHIFD